MQPSFLTERTSSLPCCCPQVEATEPRSDAVSLGVEEEVTPKLVTAESLSTVGVFTASSLGAMLLRRPCRSSACGVRCHLHTRGARRSFAAAFSPANTARQRLSSLAPACASLRLSCVQSGNATPEVLDVDTLFVRVGDKKVQGRDPRDKDYFPTVQLVAPKPKPRPSPKPRPGKRPRPRPQVPAPAGAPVPEAAPAPSGAPAPEAAPAPSGAPAPEAGPSPAGAPAPEPTPGPAPAPAA